MKKFILAAFVAALSLSPVFAQKIVQDKNGNFVEQRAPVDKLTTKTFTASNGQIYRVWLSVRGKYYVNRLNKEGKTYKYYLKITI